MSPEPHDLRGRTVDGRYDVVRHVADGGMAGVYVAHDQRLGRDVALKVLHADLARRPAFADRFEQEARAAARLSHPHVVAVHDQGRDGDVVFIAMELVRGTTLRGIIDRGGVSVERALDLADQLLAGLEAAHQRGLAHGDVKPENALVDEEGTVKLTDFGLARAASSDERSGGVLLGTASYVAPELVEQSGSADARSDVYSAGLVLAELLTGRRVFDGSRGEDVAAQHARLDVPSLGADRAETTGEKPGHRLPREVVEALDPVITAACAKNPVERPHDAGELRRRLAAARAALASQSSDALTATAIPARGREASSPAGADASGGHTEVIGSDSHTKVLIAGATPTQKRRGGRWRWILVAAVVAVLVVGLAALGLRGGSGTSTPSASTSSSSSSSRPAQVTLPDLTGQDEKTARSRLESLGLKVGASEKVVSTQPAGQVVGLTPQAGARVATSQAVTLRVSSGAATPASGQVQVPSVVGMTLGSARAVLGAFNLQVSGSGADTTPITSQTPAAGTLVAPGTSVQVR